MIDCLAISEAFTDCWCSKLSCILMCYSCFVSFQNGVHCEWMDTREVLIVNPTSSDQVDPDFEKSEKRLEEWYSRNPSKTVIATGFIASTPQDIPTTLKRDGSDFSASIMGALFKASQVTIWTDVDGVYSADPRKGLCNLTSWYKRSHTDHSPIIVHIIKQACTLWR